jgi:PAS domain S-box-containing protein
MSRNQKPSNPVVKTPAAVLKVPAVMSKNSSASSSRSGNNGLANNANMDSNMSLNETRKNIAAFAQKENEQELSKNTAQISTEYKENQNSTADKVGITSTLRREFQEIEVHISKGQHKVIIQDSIKFTMRTHQMEQAALKKEKMNEYDTIKKELDDFQEARMERKEAKRQARMTIRGTKKRDAQIQQKDFTAALIKRNREAMKAKRGAFDILITHLSDIHSRQFKDQTDAQNRQIQCERTLQEIETRNLKNDARRSQLKKHHVRENYQGIQNKRLNEQLAERQQMEVRHAKETYDAQTLSFEESGSLKTTHLQERSDLDARHVSERHDEKETQRVGHENNKTKMIEEYHAAKLADLVKNNKFAERQLEIRQAKEVAMRLRDHSDTQGATDSASEIDSKSTKKAAVAERADALVGGKAASMTSSKSFAALTKRHQEEKIALVTKHQGEINALEFSQKEKLLNLEEKQHHEVSMLFEQQILENTELKAVHAKEILIEDTMHDTEMKALLERKVLTSILETVDDGIINISPIGTLLRFNKAAENIFGWRADEVIGNNIKMLMPQEYAVNHDGYLNSFLTTGVKKVIGVPNGRRVSGLRKDGSKFPLQLSVSELKTDDTHMFTGIARDCTIQVAEEAENKEKEALENKQMEKLITNLDKSKAKANGLLSQMLPPTISKRLKEGTPVEPQFFDSATVLFLDVIDFDVICTQINPIQTVALLDSMYNVFDHIIEQYDAYKVETIGDCYMVVSGVPKENKNKHANELCTMALHLMSAISQFKFEKDPSIKIKLRMGLNSGSLVAGVVGTKMPRYCLFGDTVNTASRMKSTGKASKIQISESTYQLISAGREFVTYPRGEIEVKGKGTMHTYYVADKKGFNHPLPSETKSAK